MKDKVKKYRKIWTKEKKEVIKDSLLSCGVCFTVVAVFGVILLTIEILKKIF